MSIVASIVARNAPEPALDLEPVSIMTVLAHAIGAGLLVAAFGMWLSPGGSWSADVLVMKLGVSLFFLLCGLSLICPPVRRGFGRKTTRG